MTFAQRLGLYGEYSAVRALMENGYYVLRQNYKSAMGEIDIIAQKGDIIAFIEVKTRSNKDYTQPRDYVTRDKQFKIIQTALQYIKQIKYDGQIRFDVIEVLVTKENPKPVCTHIVNAFDASDLYIGY